MEAIQESMDKMMQKFQDQISRIENEVRKAPPSTSSNHDLATELSSLKLFVLQGFENLKQQIMLLTLNIDRLDMHSRRKILLFHGIPENKKEDSMDTINKFIKDKFNVQDFSTEQIQRCHRMGRQVSAKQRPILVKFRDIDTRNKIWFSKTILKGTGVTVSEFLTKLRHNIFIAAREKFGMGKCWTRDGVVHVVGSDGVRHRVNSLEALNKIIIDNPPINEGVIRGTTGRSRRQVTIKK